MTTISARSVLEGAACVLRFGAPASAPGYTVTASKAVRLCVGLPRGEMEASMLRDGEGLVAVLEGGTVSAVPDHPVRTEQQRALSFSMRVRDPAGKWGAPLLCELDPEGRHRFSVSSTPTALVFELSTDYREKPIHLEVLLATIGATGWHDVVGCYAGPTIGLYVDGVLVDEDWPIGALPGTGRGRLLIGARGDGLSGGFQGQVDRVAVWDRALGNAEIEALCGGSSAVASRGWALPAMGNGVQYRGAPGGGFVGDCLPFFHDGVYHFYYLFDRHNHGSKFGLGAHQWAHASSTDLVHWTHHPLAIPITEEREGSICMGSMFFHEGTWYAFYATRLPDHSEHLSLATSTDGIHFTKTEPNPFASPTPPYKHGPFRDPTVFRDPKTGSFHMLVTAELQNPVVERRGGCLAHLVSSDLRHWEQKDPFLVTGYADQPECSELYFWRGWYYLVFSHFGVAHYRMSRDPFGPWEKPPVDTLDGPHYRVMKSAGFTGDRRIGAFFLDLGKGYAGYAVFRELLQHADGTLGTRWVPEMIPAAGSPVTPVFAPLGPGVTGDAGQVRISAKEGFAAAALGGVPGDMLLRFRVSPSAGTYYFGIGIRGIENFRGATSLEFEPSRRKVGWRPERSASWQEFEHASLHQVDGLDKPFTVEVLALGETLDVCIDDRRTLINRQATGSGNRLFFYCHDGEVTFDAIEIRPILKPL